MPFYFIFHVVKCMLHGVKRIFHGAKCTFHGAKHNLLPLSLTFIKGVSAVFCPSFRSFLCKPTNESHSNGKLVLAVVYSFAERFRCAYLPCCVVGFDDEVRQWSPVHSSHPHACLQTAVGRVVANHFFLWIIVFVSGEGNEVGNVESNDVAQVESYLATVAHRSFCHGGESGIGRVVRQLSVA